MPLSLVGVCMCACVGIVVVIVWFWLEPSVRFASVCRAREGERRGVCVFWLALPYLSFTFIQCSFFLHVFVYLSLLDFLIILSLVHSSPPPSLSLVFTLYWSSAVEGVDCNICHPGLIALLLALMASAQPHRRLACKLFSLPKPREEFQLGLQSIAPVQPVQSQQQGEILRAARG